MVKIITDSAADFEPDEINAMNVTQISLNVRFGEKEFKEGTEITKDEFYGLLESEPTMPSTSLPSPCDFETEFKKNMDSGDETVAVLLSSGLSGTCQSARVIKEMLSYTDCYIIDSLNATGGERILVEHAVKLRDEGKTASEIAEALEGLKKRICLYTGMDTLEYLVKGGRLSRLAGTIGTIAKIKPVMHVTTEGRPEIPFKTIGLRKCFDYITKKVGVDSPDRSYPLYVMYTHIKQNGVLLAEQLKKAGYEVKGIIGVGAVVGSHIGPRACGVVFVGTEA